MGFNIQAKKSIVGSKLTVEQSHIAEIEEYIKSLEAQNIQLLQTNTKQQEELDGMYRKFLEQEDSSERSQSLLDETNTKMISMIEHVPTADEYSRSYDLLLDYQRQLVNRTDTSNDYHMNNGDVARIARYGIGVAENFVLNDHALIPMKKDDIEARLHLSENYHEQNDGGTVNLYSSYAIAVDVIDTKNGDVKKYNVFDFDEKYKDEIGTEEMETADQLIEDQGIDVRREQEKIVAYFEKDPTLTISVVPDEKQQELYVLAERLQDYTKVYSYRDVETFIAQNQGIRSFQEFETLYRPIEEEDEIEEIETTNQLIQEDDEMIIEEKVAINKSKKKRKEKAKGFEMT